MKNKNIIKTICLIIFLLILEINIGHAQIQAPLIENSICECGAKWGAPHKDGCRFKGQTKKTTTSNRPSFEQEIINTIFSSILNNAFNNNNNSEEAEKQAKEQAAMQEKIKQERINAILARQKKHNDSIALAANEKLRKEMKPLDGTGEISYKDLKDEKPKPVVHFNCKITSFKGDIKIVNANGKLVTLSENQSADLQVGDIIATGFNSNVKLHYKFESGGEDIMMGSHTAIKIVQNKEGFYEPEIIRGKSRIYSTNNIVEEKAAEAVEKIKTEAERELNKLKRKMEVRVRCPSAVTSIRGTDFTINVDSLGNSEIIVMEGIVDVTGDFNDNKITLTAGLMCIVNGNGEIVGLYNFEMNKIDKWWEEK